MRVSILYDNEVFMKSLTADWGFSCVVEKENAPRILFDTGANGSILLDNMKKMGIKPRSIAIVFLSHSHWDHTGGLSDFLDINSDMELFVPQDIIKYYEVKKQVSVKDPVEISENVFSTGTLLGIEQSLVIRMDENLLVITGCSHPGVENILKSASQFGNPSALLGGLHGFKKFELIRDLDFICATHCTQYKQQIQNLYPDKFTGGGAGRIIEL
ncbi:MBL fold metallo-hydrolase [Candidatus Latescibacterota bacterium]